MGMGFGYCSLLGFSTTAILFFFNFASDGVINLPVMIKKKQKGVNCCPLRLPSLPITNAYIAQQSSTSC